MCTLFNLLTGDLSSWSALQWSNRSGREISLQARQMWNQQVMWPGHWGHRWKGQGNKLYWEKVICIYSLIKKKIDLTTNWLFIACCFAVGNMGEGEHRKTERRFTKAVR